MRSLAAPAPAALRGWLRPVALRPPFAGADFVTRLSNYAPERLTNYDFGRNPLQLVIRRLRLAVAALAVALTALALVAQPAMAFRDRDCADFATQAKAQHFFVRHHPRQDPHRLDADHDMLACEDNP